jgi:Ser/Thr protein kinase RdoA (MazF antagonist)
LPNTKVHDWLPLWRETAGGAAALINISENHSFRVDAADGRQFVLRLHRPRYQARATINSELAWLRAIRQETGAEVPLPIAGRDGALVQSKGNRFGVLFGFLPGAEPTVGADLVPLFEKLGALAATLHRHAESWQRPTGFVRRSWRPETILDPGGPWGDWRVAPGVNDAVRPILDRAGGHIRSDLDAYGDPPGRWGLIHADMRLANLLVDGDRLSLIDFDDSGFGWFGYDFAASVSFIETDPRVPALRESWVRGYTRIRPFGRADIRALDALVVLRRMALLAWIGSHSETDLAKSHAPRFALDTATLAEDYLRR